MLTVEKYFKVLMESVLGEAVACTVGYPDERWVAEASGPRACVFLDETETESQASDGAPMRTSGTGPVTVVRARGKHSLMLEVRLRTDNAEAQVNALGLTLISGIAFGVCFGPNSEFQVYGIIRSAKARPRDGEPRVTERVFRVPLTGPLEETGEAYPVEEVEVKVEVE